MPRRTSLLSGLARAAEGRGRARSIGQVRELVGLAISATDLYVPVGAVCEVERTGEDPLLCEVVALREEAGQRVSVLLPYGQTARITAHAPVREVRALQTAPVGGVLLGRILDGLGRPLDGRPLYARSQRSLAARVAHPLRRRLIDMPLPTGVRAVDAFTTLGRGQRIGIFSGSGVGKALALDTPIPTPQGWRTMGELRVGDRVFDEQGRSVEVLFATEVMHGRSCYELTFSDGATLVADADHLWETLDHPARKDLDRRTPGIELPRARPRDARSWGPRLHTTAELAASLMDTQRASDHAIPLAGPLQYAERELPVEPFGLGIWLGAGTSACAAVTAADPQLRQEVEHAGYEVRPQKAPLRYGVGRRSGQRKPLPTELRSLGVLGNEHIPRQYLEASVAQRTALLQGLLDTGAERRADGELCFTTTKEQLARDVFELVTGLGLRPRMWTRGARPHGKASGTAWNIFFTTDRPTFRPGRRRSRQHPTTCPTPSYRRIAAVRPVASVPVRCIGVGSASHLYLAGRACVPTHNSTLLGMIARDNAADANVVALIGERNREVQDFINDTLGPEGLRRSVVVVATGDEPALIRARAATLAATIAEDLREQGLDVSFFCDSITRFASAQREIGLAAGEPAIRGGYTPSVFQALPELLERSGMGERGSITGFYTVLVEADDDIRDPIADEVRARLDGHILLDRALNEAGHFPPLDVVGSLSRVMARVTDAEHREDATLVRSLIAAYRDKQVLIEGDAYERGTNPRVDAALALMPHIDRFLIQGVADRTDMAASRAMLREIAVAARRLLGTEAERIEASA